MAPKKAEKLRKFNPKWRSEPWGKGWLVDATEQKGSFQDAFCNVCKSHLRAHKSDLIRHSKTPSHEKNMITVRGEPSQRKLTDNQIVIVSNKQKEKDLILALHVGIHSSLRTMDHLGNIINRISDGSIDVNMARTKCSLLLKKVLAPSIREELISDLADKPYSLVVDESTDIATVKYLCVCVRYYSEKLCEIVVAFLGLVEIERATADALYDSLKIFLKSLGINVQNMIGLGTDGANNLCGINNSLFTKLRQENSNLQLVKCICHSIDNAASKASEELPSNLDFLCREIYSWFSHSSLRQIEYKRLFDTLNSGCKTFHKFVQLCPTRWLARYNAVNTILEHYEELKTHFKFVVQKEKCYTSRIINEMLEDKVNYFYFLIIRPILYEVNNLNINFQANNVEVGTACDEICQVIMFLAKKIMKPEFVSDFNYVKNNCDNDLAYLEVKDMDFGINYHRERGRSGLTTSQADSLEFRCFIYMKSLLKELLKRLPTSFNYFRNLQLLSPNVCLSQIKSHRFADLPLLDIFADQNNIHILENQFNKLNEIHWASQIGTNALNNSYQFWPAVLNYKNAAGKQVVKELASFALKVLSLPMSNASAERIFSQMNLTKTKIRNRMQFELLNALLSIKSHCIVNRVCCSTFQVTKTMLEKFNYKIYQNDKLENEPECDDVNDLLAVVEDDIM